MANNINSKKRNTTGKSNRNATREKKGNKSEPLNREILFLFILVISILILLSLFHIGGFLGDLFSSLFFGLFGIMAYVLPFYLIGFFGFYISNENPEIRKKVWLSLGIYLGLCGLCQWILNSPVGNVFEIYTICTTGIGGGFIGGLLSYELAKLVGRIGALIIILALILLCFMLISRKLIFSSLYKYFKENKGKTKRYRNEYYYENEDSYYENEDSDIYDDVIYEDNTNRKVISVDLRGEKRKKIAGNIGINEKENENGNENEKERSGRNTKENIKENIKEEKEEIKNDDNIRIIRGDQAEKPIFQREMEEKFGNKFDVKEEKEPFKKESVQNKALGNAKQAEKNTDTEKNDSIIKEEVEKSVSKEIPYKFPPLDLLTPPLKSSKSMGDNELVNTANKLKATLESFGVEVTMGDISIGPSVTRYELTPAIGVKVSKITSLTDDIKLALAASDIRIEAPIPNKSAIGIEVPNPNRATVTLRELLESSEFQKAKSKVTFAVGKDISGKTIVTDIAKMPHLLIAGATGSGKSVLINTLIMSIIYKADPNDVKMIMVDPKMVELTAYEGIPHLMIPVVKDPKLASSALAWAVNEMQGRYNKFTEAGVRDIASYNAKIKKAKLGQDSEFKKMPQIVIVVDEFADLMMVAKGDVENSVCRLAQLARAAGIHLVLATQRPSVDVITGLIKANIPSRIALSVSSQVDSRTILDGAGAENLLGNGDMLFYPQNLPNPLRVQGAFVSDDDRDKVISFLKANVDENQVYDESVTKTIEKAHDEAQKQAVGISPGERNDRDELFEEAGRIIIDKKKASIGAIQRFLQVGFNRAARIMDQLCEAGVVGDENGTKPREILMSKEEFESMLQNNDEEE